MSVKITLDGIRDFEAYFAILPAAAEKAASRAINRIMDRDARKLAIADMQRQVNFPPGYLESPGRLKVTQYATPQRLEGKLTGRDRPTSLARFAPAGTPVARKGGPRARGGRLSGVAVSVKPGQSTTMRGGFLYTLKSGNIGFAYRTPDGRKPTDAYHPTLLFKDKGRGAVWLLYGPSVDQVFQTVADDIRTPVTVALEAEFLRMFDLLANGRIT